MTVAMSSMRQSARPPRTHSTHRLSNAPPHNYSPDAVQISSELGHNHANVAVMFEALDVPEMVGSLVRLEHLTHDHTDGLTHAAAEDRATYRYSAIPDGREATHEYVTGLLAARAGGETIPFAQVRTVDGRVVGVTRYLSLRARPDAARPFAVEIGGTWLAASAQRSGINVEAKYLLLIHAFESWKVKRVDFKSDARNDRSRVAIAALGAVHEGVLRNWQPSQVVDEDDELRDSAMYSIIEPEWPAVLDKLRARLAARRSK